MLQNVIPWGTPLQDTFEIWEQRRPVMGDHIRVQRYHGLYAHPSAITVCTPIMEFMYPMKRSSISPEQTMTASSIGRSAK